MTQKEFFKKHVILHDKIMDTEMEILKEKDAKKKIKLNLQLLGYNEQKIQLWTIGKTLNFVGEDLANFTISNKIKKNKEIYEKLVQLKQLVK